LALRGAGDEAGDVHELDHRRHHLLRLRDLGDHLEAPVGHLDDADVRLDGAEGIVLGGDARLGERIEERRLADVRQAHDAALHFLPNRPLRRPFFSGAGCGGSFTGGSFFSGSFLAGGFSSVCSLFMAACMSPDTIWGMSESALSIAASIALFSSASGRSST